MAIVHVSIGDFTTNEFESVNSNIKASAHQHLLIQFSITIYFAVCPCVADTPLYPVLAVIYGSCSPAIFGY